MYSNWDLYRVFCVVAELGSLSASAGSLGLSAATVSRRISALEDALGAPLFRKGPDGYQLTQAGDALYPMAMTMLDASLAIERQRPFVGRADRRVRVATGHWFARYILERAPGFLREQPEAKLDIVADVGLRNLGRHEADVAIRNVRPESGRITVRALGEMRYAIYGGADYVQANACAFDERRYQTCQWVDLIGTPRVLATSAWLNERIQGAPIVRCTLSTQVLTAVQSGVGLGLLPRVFGDADRKLVRVSESIELPNGRCWLVVHEDLREFEPVRSFADWLVKTVENDRGVLSPPPERQEMSR